MSLLEPLNNSIEVLAGRKVICLGSNTKTIAGWCCDELRLTLGMMRSKQRAREWLTGGGSHAESGLG